MVIHGNSSPIDGNFHGLTLLSKATCGAHVILVGLLAHGLAATFWPGTWVDQEVKYGNKNRIHYGLW
jgi:hypothetical protein